jgi:UPF0716 family protein affecting phage T7 exclusion
MMPMTLAFGIAAHTGVRLAEVGFLLVVIAGVWLAASQLQQFRFGTVRTVVAGVLLAVAGILLIIATHWGHFG